MLSGRGLCDGSLVQSVVCLSVIEEPRTEGLGSLRLERERGGGRARARERERETGRQAGRPRQRRQRDTDRQTDRQTERARQPLRHEFEPHKIKNRDLTSK